MFNPQNFLALATTLSSQVSNDENISRTCVGRAYYAAHLSARERIRRYYPVELQHLSRPGDEHWFVRDKLTERRHGNIAGKLLDLSRWRARADYDLSNYGSITDQNKEVAKAIQLSQNIISLLAGV